LYEKFFQQVVRFEGIKDALGTVVLNGQPTDLRQYYTLRDATGLTDQEARVLDALASDCEDKLRSSNDRAKPLIFAARLRLIESESDAQAAQQLKEFDDEQRQIVLAHVQQLKASFGDYRFNVLDAFVRSGKQVVSFLPLPKVKAAAPVADGGTPRQPK
jgi:N-methylhydantoinase A/oxoprolinase/acetone carboxylase beta subunit